MSKVSFQARLHRWQDSLQLLATPSRRTLHRELRALLDVARLAWPSADYGAGYLYQSCPSVGLRGFRRTDERMAAMDLGADLQNRTVLEVGCNTGFLSLGLATGTRRYVAFDNNPYLISIARLVARFLNDSAVEFCVERFETLREEQTFEVALSFANHSTWDGNMSLSLELYFAKLRRLLVPGGLLYFESHHPTLENDRQLAATLEILAQHFDIQSQRRLNQGSPWDRGRTLVKARARALD